MRAGAFVAACRGVWEQFRKGVFPTTKKVLRSRAVHRTKPLTVRLIARAPLFSEAILPHPMTCLIGLDFVV